VTRRAAVGGQGGISVLTWQFGASEKGARHGGFNGGWRLW
jgi:hypothetical protein